MRTDSRIAHAAFKKRNRFQRTTFRIIRLHFSRKALAAQTGHEVDDWPLVIIKEVIDNALDACEEAGIAPVIAVTVDRNGIEICDDGPGLPAKTVDGVLNYTVRVSCREAYVSPTRGAQGNALKTLIAMPFALTVHGFRSTFRDWASEETFVSQ